MSAFIIAKPINPIRYSDKTTENTINLPIKPAVSGMPARENMAIVSVNAINGFFLASPLKLSKLDEPVSRLTNIKTANAIIDAIEYAVAYTNTALVDAAPKSNVANNK